MASILADVISVAAAHALQRRVRAAVRRVLRYGDASTCR
ncbi:Uncharacterized protein ToN1_17940 [Aromatoleum petrolei]|nr:Uncharacterized protein ToN1_17940 [Aromatoleum petrolei]